MTDEFEQEPESVEPSADITESADLPSRDSGFRRRPFASWSSARSEERSLWSRIRDGVAGLFRRSKAESLEEEAEPAVEEDAASAEVHDRYDGVDDAEPGLGSAAHAVASRGSWTDPEADAPPAAAAEPAPAPPSEAELLFLDVDVPAAPPDPEPAVAIESADDLVASAEELVAAYDIPVDDSAPPAAADGSGDIAEIGDVVEREDEIEITDDPPAVPPRKSRGFLARLFGRATPAEGVEALPDSELQPGVEAEADVETSLAIEWSSDVEAQPAAGTGSTSADVGEDRRDTAEMEAVDEPDPFEPVEASAEPDEPPDDEPGFFGRLFGRGRRVRDVEPATSGAADDWTSLDSGGVDAIAPRDAVPETEPEVADVSMYGGPDPFTPVKIREPAAFAETLDVQPTPASASAFDRGADQDVGAATLEAEIGERTTDEFQRPDLPPPGADEEDTAEVAKGPGFFGRLLGRKRKSGEAEPQQEVEPGFLHAKFRQFYSEILRFKHQKTQVASGFATAIVDYTADISPEATATQLSNRLKELLELQSAEAAWMKGEYAARYPDAQYAMAALADEIFSELDWPGRSAYPQVRLEQRLFKSSDADVEVFRRIDRLLREPQATAEAKDLARVYLLVLASGFQGKWRPFGLVRPIAEYRRRLYEFLCGGDALLLYGNEPPLMPQTVSTTLAGSAVSRFTAAQRWTVLLIVLLATYVVLAQMGWRRISTDLEDLTSRIVSASSTRGAP